MEKEFQIPDNIQVIDKPEDYDRVIAGIKIVEKQPVQTSNTSRPVRPSIKTVERTYEGYTIPDNISVIESPDDFDQLMASDMGNLGDIVGEIEVVEIIPEDELPEKGPEPISEEEIDIWKQVEEEFIDSEFLIEDGDKTCIDKEKMFTWLKEKLSGISFCQTYLSDKVDGENGIVKENATLMLQTEKGSKLFLNKAGKYHRLDGPAIEWNYGAKEYFKNGIRHRLDGPAYESKDEKQFWFEGKQYMEAEYWVISKEIENLK
jgi:hypothetical protein